MARSGDGVKGAFMEMTCVAGTGPRVFVDTGVGLQFLDMYVRWPG